MPLIFATQLWTYKKYIYPQYYSNTTFIVYIVWEKSNNKKSDTYVTFITPLRMWLRRTLKSMDSNAVSELLSSSTITVRRRSYLGRRNCKIIEDMIQVALIYRLMFSIPSIYTVDIPWHAYHWCRNSNQPPVLTLRKYSWVVQSHQHELVFYIPECEDHLLEAL